MIEPVATPAAVLALWERGVGRRPGRRALVLLAGAASEAAMGDWARAPAGRRDRALLDLRERLFGRRFTGLTSCPRCDEPIELTFDAAEVRRDTAGIEAATVRVDGIDVAFRLPNAGDLEAIDGEPDVPSARARLVARCVGPVTRDGEAIAVEAWSPGLVEAVAARMAEIDPQADVALDLDCPACAHAWREPFDIVTFFWVELAASARRILDDVHVIASAYGWSETEILALSPARRSAYLEMLG